MKNADMSGMQYAEKPHKEDLGRERFFRGATAYYFNTCTENGFVVSTPVKEVW